MEVNFGNVAEHYSQFRNDLPDDLFQCLRLRGVDFKNKRVVDLGAGTGILTREISKQGAIVLGVEPSIELIAEAERIDQNEGIKIQYINGYSESIALADHQYDYVTAIRAWHWFDREKTLNEVKRILKEEGTLLVMDSGFQSNNIIVQETKELVNSFLSNGEIKPAGSKAQSKLLINSFPVEWFQEWKDHHFDLIDCFKFEYTVTFSNEEWCGRVGSLSWLANLSVQKRKEILDSLYQVLSQKYGDVKYNIKHTCYVAILKNK